jgi:hypothetical protein
VTSRLFLPAFFASNFAAWILKLDPTTLDTLGWVVLLLASCCRSDSQWRVERLRTSAATR